jgi:hypothetical protein
MGYGAAGYSFVILCETTIYERVNVRDGMSRRSVDRRLFRFRDSCEGRHGDRISSAVLVGDIV